MRPNTSKCLRGIDVRSHTESTQPHRSAVINPQKKTNLSAVAQADKGPPKSKAIRVNTSAVRKRPRVIKSKRGTPRRIKPEPINSIIWHWKAQFKRGRIRKTEVAEGMT